LKLSDVDKIELFAHSRSYTEALLLANYLVTSSYGNADAVINAIGDAEFYSRSHHAVIRVYDAAGNVIETHDQAGEFKEP